MDHIWDDTEMQAILPDTLPTTAVSNATSFICPDCGRGYQRQRSLQRHRRYECGVEKKFTCAICWKNFKRPDQLHKHQKIHKTLDKELAQILDDTNAV
jgi:DNA-directed RNA polymerase subunit RPC12/RpoP